MRNNLLLILFILYTFPLQAQSEEKRALCNYVYNNNVDLSLNYSKNQFAGALAWSHLHGFGPKKKKFKIGYGLRFTTFTAGNKFYTTAPSKFTSTVQNLGTINSVTLTENIDSIALQTAQVNFLNISIHLQYTISKFDIGFNIDALGCSFGTQKKANIVSSVYDTGQEPIQTASPTVFNLLLTSDNDYGSLNSEFYLRYWIMEKFAIRAGYTFLFSEYTTEQKLSFDNHRIENDRYRLKSSMLLLGITYRPFVKN